MLVHTVFFNFKQGVSEDQVQKCRVAAEELGRVDTVSAAYAGKPAATPDRPVSQRDYQLGLTLVFDSVEAHDQYQIDSIHQEFVDEFSGLWERVRVFDTE